MDPVDAFRAAVRERRHELGLSQERLAELAGLDRTYVSSLERGRRNPTLKTAARLAGALNLPLAELLRDSDA